MSRIKGTFSKWGLSDIGQMWSIKPMRLAMLGVLALPLVYSFIYLWAFFDPYENMEKLPVAIVNEDKGAVLDEESIQIGDDLVEELREDSKLKWEFVSRVQMEQGFKDGDYYMGVVIPEDFSEKAKSVASAEPLKGELEYYTDESNNYLSARLGESIIRELEKSLGEKLTHVYVEKIFNKMKESAYELAKAADGADTLAYSTKKAADKTNEIHDGVHQLQAGSNQIYQGLLELKNRVEEAKGEMDQSLSKVLAAQKNVHEINKKIQAFANEPIDLPGDSINEIHDQLNTIKIKVDQTNRNNEQSEQLIKQLIQDHPELASDPNANKLISSLSENSSHYKQMQKHVDELKPAIEKSDVDLDQYHELRQKIAQQSQMITDKVDHQVAKVIEMSSAADQLIAGMDQIIAGQSKLLNGLNKLADGTDKLEKGLYRIHDGQTELADGLTDGVKEAREQLKGSDQKQDVISDPVHVEENSYHPVPNYATGFAPYFISLSLWVGAMILFTVVDLYQLPEKLGGRPISMAAGAIVGAAQAVITTAALTLGLGIEAELPGWLYLFTILMSFTFMAINQMLVGLLKNVGRFVAIILLMFQLTSSAGTYPLELLPPLFQTLHHYLPMTYSVHGLRAVLSNGNVSAVIHDAYILLGFLAGSYVVTQIHHRWVKPQLSKWLSSFKKKKEAEVREYQCAS